ncbi:MAG: hypothetical protein RLZZ602_866 [Pseudomonadota bacterium]|jgi:uncharacterized RDD family membrane protein YckC
MSPETQPSLGRHLMALVYDTFLVVPIIMLTTALIMGLYVTILPPPAAQTDIVALPPAAVQSGALLSVALFYFIFWRRGGQTLGMQAWRIKLVDLTGARADAGQLIMRLLAATLAYGLFGLGLAWRFVDRDGLYLHDRMSGTKLVQLPKK